MQRKSDFSVSRFTRKAPPVVGGAFCIIELVVKEILHDIF